MPTSARHTIQRQTVLLDTPGQPPSFGLQDRVSAYCRNQLPAVLETLFDRLSDADTTIRLDQLTLDLGSLPLEKLEDELTQRISRQIEQTFQQISEQNGQSFQQASGQTGARKSGNDNDGTDAGRIAGRLERMSNDQRMAQQFRYFLLNGRLPAWAASRSFEPLDKWLMTPAATGFRSELMRILQDKPELESRLIHHSSDQTLTYLLVEASHEALSVPIRLLLIAAQKLTRHPLATVREHYWRAALAIARSTATTGNRTMANRLLAFHKALAPSQSTGLFFNQLRTQLKQETDTDVLPEAMNLMETLTELIRENSPTSRPVAQTPPTDAATNEYGKQTSQPDTASIALTRHDEASAPENGSDQARTASTSNRRPVSESPFPTRNDATVQSQPSRESTRPVSRKNTSDGEDLFVPLSGIVLLHPFLIPLFSEMKLLTNRQWTDEAAAVKGVQTLAYLATGQDYCPEYEMPLLKLLCGLPFDAVVSPNLDLTDTEKQYAAELLDAVIGHWSALGKVSPDGLRETFLQREGKLTPAEPGWRLTVERKTVDILMGKLPWGFSTIKLPVMTDLLFVDWNE